jgi:hypothetical protein
MKKSSSYPESLNEIKTRELSECIDINIEITDVLQNFKEKDHSRTERMAEIGSEDSTMLNPPNKSCKELFIRMIYYLLEISEESRKREKLLYQQSYVGFFFFIKWLVRSIFLLVFTTFGSISGKEIGCLIKSHSSCGGAVAELAGASPHIISTIIGLLFGLLIGQWIGKFLWDSITKHIMREFELYGHKLYVISVFTLILTIATFSTVFYFFVHIKKNDRTVNSIIGASIGISSSLIGILIYRSKCSQ